jgi:anti-sigma B factor antagonist
MSQRSRGIFVTCTQAAVFVRILGRGACHNSEAFRQFGLAKLREGYRQLYVDFLNCEGLDSTFLGVIAGLGLALGDSGCLSLLNLSGDSLKAFDCLGLEHLTSVKIAPWDEVQSQFPAASVFQMLPGSDATAKDRVFDALQQALLMLECHENLCRIDSRNEEKLRDVTQFLREDIARQSEGKPKPRL